MIEWLSGRKATHSINLHCRQDEHLSSAKIDRFRKIPIRTDQSNTLKTQKQYLLK
jgi:hypothetical protein